MIAQGANTGTIVTHLKLVKGRYEQDLKAAERSIKNYEKQTGDSMKRISSMSTKMEAALTTTAVAGVAALGMIAGAAIKTGIAFTSEMKKVQAYTSATEKEYKRLAAAAREWGSKTEWSATQSAESLKYLAAAGLTVEQSIKALPATLDLATAGQLALGQATDIATDTMTAFGMKVQELTRVNDALATTASSSNTTIEMLGESMKYVAPAAGQLGYTVEQTSAMLGVLANSGIKASIAGTNLQRAMIHTNKVAKEMGMEGASLIEVLKQMKKEQWDMNMIEEKFGLIAAKSVAVLMNQVDAYEELHGKIERNVGAAKTLADTMRDTLGNDIKVLTSAIQENLLKAFEMMEGDLRNGIQAITSAVVAFGEFHDWVKKLQDLGKIDWTQWFPGAGQVAGFVSGMKQIGEEWEKLQQQMAMADPAFAKLHGRNPATGKAKAEVPFLPKTDMAMRELEDLSNEWMAINDQIDQGLNDLAKAEAKSARERKKIEEDLWKAKHQAHEDYVDSWMHTTDERRDAMSRYYEDEERKATEALELQKTLDKQRADAAGEYTDSWLIQANEREQVEKRSLEAQAEAHKNYIVERQDAEKLLADFMISSFDDIGSAWESLLDKMLQMALQFVAEMASKFIINIATGASPTAGIAGSLGSLFSGGGSASSLGSLGSVGSSIASFFGGGGSGAAAGAYAPVAGLAAAEAAAAAAATNAAMFGMGAEAAAAAAAGGAGAAGLGGAASAGLGAVGATGVGAAFVGAYMLMNSFLGSEKSALNNQEWMNIYQQGGGIDPYKGTPIDMSLGDEIAKGIAESFAGKYRDIARLGREDEVTGAAAALTFDPDSEMLADFVARAMKTINEQAYGNTGLGDVSASGIIEAVDNLTSEAVNNWEQLGSLINTGDTTVNGALELLRTEAAAGNISQEQLLNAVNETIANGATTQGEILYGVIDQLKITENGMIQAEKETTMHMVSLLDEMGTVEEAIRIGDEAVAGAVEGIASAISSIEFSPVINVSGGWGGGSDERNSQIEVSERSSGGWVHGPSSGYPATLHGSELVLNKPQARAVKSMLGLGSLGGSGSSVQVGINVDARDPEIENAIRRMLTVTAEEVIVNREEIGLSSGERHYTL
jgi:TP901 family phage tail tape measure protein